MFKSLTVKMFSHFLVAELKVFEGSLKKHFFVTVVRRSTNKIFRGIISFDEFFLKYLHKKPLAP